MTLRVALAGDTMLGRGVATALAQGRPLLAGEVVDLVAEADLFILNLECCISERGERWPAPGKPFYFRAPPAAVDVLQRLGVDCVTLANNHALDYGVDALIDTLDLLAAGGIAVVGAGRHLGEARAPAVLSHRDFRLRVVGLTDHPRDYQAGLETPGVAYADLGHGVPEWVFSSMTTGQSDATLVTPHWGPNMTSRPLPYVRAAARALLRGGASLVAGHSAHVFHGVTGRVLFDLGDFIDDYAVDHSLRNDLGLLFFVDLSPAGPYRLEAVPLALDYCHTRLADEDESAWIRRRFSTASAELGTTVRWEGGRLVADLAPAGATR